MPNCCPDKKDNALLCYCFNISKQAYLEALDINQDTTITNFIIFQTKHHYCHCAMLNPSGQCCLKDFKRLKKSRTITQIS